MLESLGPRIRAARKAKGMTQEDLAESIGAARPSISNWENNKVKPDSESLSKLAEILDIPLSHLLDDDGKDNNKPHRLNSDETLEEKPNARLIENVVMIPIISDKNVTACCGEGSYYASDVQWEIEDYFPIPQSETIGYSWQGYNLKLIKATGVSMEPYIKEGDLILFAELYEVHERDIAVIALDGKVFVKGIVSMTKDYILLRAYNWQVSPDIKVELDGGHDIAILGKVIKIISTRTVPQLS